jgi:alpha/beta superfamily hydrolase
MNAGPPKTHDELADSFAERGLVCMKVEYRTRGKDGVLPGEDLTDAAAAMRWVRPVSRSFCKFA